MGELDPELAISRTGECWGRMLVRSRSKPCVPVGLIGGWENISPLMIQVPTCNLHISAKRKVTG